MEDPVYLEWKSGQDQTEEANHGGLRSSEIEKAHVREAQHGWQGESAVGGNVFEYKIIGSSDMDFGGARYCPKKRKSLQGEAQKPYAKQASQENHQVVFKSFIWTPDKMVSKIVPKS